MSYPGAYGYDEGEWVWRSTFEYSKDGPRKPARSASGWMNRAKTCGPKLGSPQGGNALARQDEQLARVLPARMQRQRKPKRVRFRDDDSETEAKPKPGMWPIVRPVAKQVKPNAPSFLEQPRQVSQKAKNIVRASNTVSRGAPGSRTQLVSTDQSSSRADVNSSKVEFHETERERRSEEFQMFDVARHYERDQQVLCDFKPQVHHVHPQDARSPSTGLRFKTTSDRREGFESLVVVQDCTCRRKPSNSRKPREAFALYILFKALKEMRDGVQDPLQTTVDYLDPAHLYVRRVEMTYEMMRIFRRFWYACAKMSWDEVSDDVREHFHALAAEDEPGLRYYYPEYASTEEEQLINGPFCGKLCTCGAFDANLLANAKDELDRFEFARRVDGGM